MIRNRDLYEDLDYPMGKQSTTVGGVFKRLGLLKGSALRRAVREGKITVSKRKVAHTWDRVAGGEVIEWCEYRIRVRIDEDAKRRRLIQEYTRLSQMRGGISISGKGGGGGGK